MSAPGPHMQTHIHASSHAGTKVISFAEAAMVSLSQNLLHHLLSLLKRKNMVTIDDGSSALVLRLVR